MKTSSVLTLRNAWPDGRDPDRVVRAIDASQLIIEFLAGTTDPGSPLMVSVFGS